MRLTNKRNGKNVIPLLMAVCGIDLPYWRIDRADNLHSYLSGDAADKLAAYEDTGFEPEDVGQMGNALKLQSVMVNEASHYWNLQQQGLLVILPCKVGTPVWSSVMCRFDENGEEQPMQWPFMLSMMDEWGTGFFLTYEEAEAALKGEQNDGTT